MARGIVTKDRSDFLGVVGLLRVGDEVERVRQMGPRLVHVDLCRVARRRFWRAMSVMAMQTGAAALLPCDAVAHLLVEKCVEVLWRENSLTFLPRMPEGSFHHSRRGYRGVVELRLCLGGELVEMRPEVLLERLRWYDPPK